MNESIFAPEAKITLVPSSSMDDTETHGPQRQQNLVCSGFIL